MRERSMYNDYIKELHNRETIESDNGFVTYSFEKDSVYIQDIYVIPNMRKSNEASRLADCIAEIAKSRDIKILLGSVIPSYNNSTASMKILLAYGFKIDSSANNFILLKKELV